MYALITGAGSGCGFEYARIMAQKGYDLLIVSNEEAIHDKPRLLGKGLGGGGFTPGGGGGDGEGLGEQRLWRGPSQTEEGRGSSGAE